MQNSRILLVWFFCHTISNTLFLLVPPPNGQEQGCCLQHRRDNKQQAVLLEFTIICCDLVERSSGLILRPFLPSFLIRSNMPPPSVLQLGAWEECQRYSANRTVDRTAVLVHSLSKHPNHSPTQPTAELSLKPGKQAVQGDYGIKFAR